MHPWSEDFSTSTLEELLQKHAENRAWSKELRHKATQLVKSRLANEISQADYLASRKLGHEESAECRRRAAILDSQIARCMLGPQKREGESRATEGPTIASPDIICHT